MIWWLVPAVVLAAPGDDFYQRMYQRGMTHFAAADYAAAFAELRSAAFGFVEKVDQFETAQSYACIAAHRLGHDNDVRDSLMRIVSAERLQPHYRAISLPDSVRTEVDGLAAELLTQDEAALLGVTVAARKAVDVPTPSKQPNVAVTAPRNAGADSAPPANDPKPAPQPVQSSIGAIDARLNEAQRAFDGGDLDGAHSIYTDVSSAPSLSHDSALRLAEGLYCVHDFARAAQAFVRAGALEQGEERYHYDYAVALYETRSYANARRELAAGLPYVMMTPEVERYRAKIEGAAE